MMATRIKKYPKRGNMPSGPPVGPHAGTFTPNEWARRAKKADGAGKHALAKQYRTLGGFSEHDEPEPSQEEQRAENERLMAAVDAKPKKKAD